MGSWLDRWFGRTGASRAGDGAGAGIVPPFAASSAAATLADWKPALDLETLFVRWLLDAPRDGPSAIVTAEQQAIDALQGAAASGHAASLVPRVPSVVPQLLHTLRDSAPSVHGLAQQVAQDPVLVAAVLRGANSAYYRTTRPVESLDQAVLVLGHDGLRQLVASVAFRPLMNIQSGQYTKPGAPRIWEQSERTAAACRTLAADAGASGFEAYLASLLHNVGNVVALRLLDQQATAAALPASTAFCHAFHVLTVELGCAIGRQWQFPERIVDALAQPPDAMPASPLALLFAIGERIGTLSVLADAGRIAPEDVFRAIEGREALARSFNELHDRAAAAA